MSDSACHDWLPLLAVSANLLATLVVPVPSVANVDAGASAPDSGDATSSSDENDSGRADTSAASEAGEPPPAERLEERYDLSEDALDSRSRLSDRRESTISKISRLESSLEPLEENLVVERSKHEAIAEQSESLPRPGPVEFVAGLARQTIAKARLEAKLEHVRAALDRARQLVSLLDARLEKLEDEKQAQDPDRRDQRSSRERAERAERSAEKAVELARRRERRERNRKIKKLHARQRNIAEERLESTRSFQRKIREIRRVTSDSRESFAEREAEILDELNDVPASPTPRTQKDTIDPIFEELLAVHDEKSKTHAEALEQRRSADDRLERARRQWNKANDELREARRQHRDHDESKLWERRLELAEARRKLHRQKVDEAEELLRARRRRARTLREQLGSLERSMQELLPRVSHSTYDSFYSLFDEKNWTFARDNLGWRLRSVYDRVRERSAQVGEILEDPFSLSLWAAIGGLAWRLLALFLLLRIVFPAIPTLGDALTSRLLKRRFFERRPALTVRIVDVLLAVAKPASIYLVVRVVAAYLATLLPELELALWTVDAIFIYWVVVGVLSVLVSPRAKPEPPPAHDVGRTSDDLRSTPLEEARAAAALNGLEPARAEKFLRSAKVVALFWILAAYIPDFLARYTGPSVLLYLVRQTATWGFIVVLYWVLSTWRDDISELFARLAGPRLDRGVDFVRRHKDRPWGVLVIALASVYVFFVEILQLGRRYLLNADWYQRARNFVFQKSVELQQSKGSEESSDASPTSQLPKQYTRLFEDAPLSSDDDRLVEERREPAVVLDYYADWCEHGRQGSVALVGESGVGRTTSMRRIAATLEADDDAPPLIAERADQKLAETSEVLAWLAEAFELPDVPADRMELVDEICQLDRRIVLLDDCENVFLRRTGGFEGLEALLDVVTLTDETHFWVLSFHNFSWSYINRIRERSHYFGTVVEIEPWSESQIRTFIENRNELSDWTVDFGSLDSTASTEHPDRERGGRTSDRFVDVVQEADRYFRYLTTFAEGNPWVAATYWLRSVEYDASTDQLSVHLFRRPTTEPLVDMQDDYWFVLTALAQHAELDAEALAATTNIDIEFCTLALDYFEELNVVEVDPVSGRARISSMYFRQVLNHLSNANFLYG